MCNTSDWLLAVLAQEAPQEYERVMRQHGGGLVVCCATLQRRQEKSAAASASKQRYGANRDNSDDRFDSTGITAFVTLQGCREKSSAYRYSSIMTFSASMRLRGWYLCACRNTRMLEW